MFNVSINVIHWTLLPLKKQLKGKKKDEHDNDNTKGKSLSNLRHTIHESKVRLYLAISCYLTLKCLTVTDIYVKNLSIY